MTTLPTPAEGPETVEGLIKSIKDKHLEVVNISDNEFRAAIILLVNDIKTNLGRIANILEQGK